MRETSKGERDDNIIWAEVRGFRFTRDNDLSHEELKECCTTATSGDIIFRPWTHVCGEEMQLPLVHLIKKKPSGQQWSAHLTQAKRRQNESQRIQQTLKPDSQVGADIVL
jgi:hypothetical protein